MTVFASAPAAGRENRGGKLQSQVSGKTGFGAELSRRVRPTGVGLIGSSIAHAVNRDAPAGAIVVADKSPKTLGKANANTFRHGQSSFISESGIRIRVRAYGMYSTKLPHLDNCASRFGQWRRKCCCRSSRISMRTVSPNFMNDVVGLPFSMVSIMRISAMQE